jgi:Co/Zn/Cd efflux system component
VCCGDSFSLFVLLAATTAMAVDVVTYLFNFLAERFKHRIHDSKSKRMTARDIRLHRLYLELIPPFISVVTLVAVTVMGLSYAIAKIRENSQDQATQPDLKIMLLFSGLNLLLDILNVSCFARVDQAVGLSSLSQRPTDFLLTTSTNESSLRPTETTALLPDDDDDDAGSEDTEAAGGLNLNMCSAWTHVCADTLRSVAVLIAAGFAFLFPKILTAADADSWGAIVVSVIILVSLVPLLEGLYLTACKIHQIWYGSHEGGDHQHSDRIVKAQMVLTV